MFKDIGITVKKCIWRALREGKSFEDMLSRLKEIDGYSREELEKLQLESLRDIVRHSYLNVPYYKRLFDEAGFDINKKFGAGDIRKIPYLTRERILKDPDSLISRTSAKFLLRKAGTSGTTGTPIVLYRDLYSITFENAIFWKQKDWAGIRKGERKATLRGDVLIPASRKRPPFWRYDYMGRELMLSSFHIAKDTARYYAEILKEFKPAYVEAYPSSLYVLAKFIKENGLKGVSFKTAIVGSETMQDYKKSLIEEVFNCKVYDYYGNAERVIAIATCPKGNHHVIPEYGFVEFIDCKDNEGYKEMVGTSFINMSMPLIRYKTGDIVMSSGRECECGRRSQVIDKIMGRLTEFVITPEGRFVALMDCVYKGLKNIIEAQLVQEDYENIRVKVVPDEDFSDSDGNELIERIQRRLGSGMNICIDKVDSIIRTGNDKFRSVVSMIKDKGI